ncbi:MAG: 7-cyano-7-deazaguanine synthase [Chitinophagales bacterium]|nr:7-cyano-7-deazaguanine synthase [Chitinophagales bacterium]
MSKKAILLSGGMDSIALAYWKKPSLAFTIDYGQLPASKEIISSKEVTNILGIEHHIISVNCAELGSGDLVGKGAAAISPSTEWWPFRNQLLITFALMKAITLEVNEIMVGSVKTDEFHSDGTKFFYDIMNQLSNFQEGKISVTCPAIEMTTSELISVSNIPKNILLWAHSCHKSAIPCGNCRGCFKYANVVSELNLF